MGFFSDLKDDLSQAVNELSDQININEKEATGEQAEAVEQLDEELVVTAKQPSSTVQELSLNEMLDKIDEFGLPEEFMQETLDFEQEELPEEESFLVDGRMLAVKMPDAEMEDWTDEADGFDLEPLWKKIEEESDQPTLSEEELEELLKTQQVEQSTEWQEMIQEGQPEEHLEVFKEGQPGEQQKILQERTPEGHQEIFQKGTPEEQQEIFQEGQPKEQQEIFQEGQPKERRAISWEEQSKKLQEKTIEIQNKDFKGAEKEMETSTARTTVDAISIIAETMTITGDIVTEGSIELLGTVNGNIDVLGKLSITGHINGNSKAAEVYAENARINGEIVSEGAVKIGASSVIIGNITASSAVIAGAVEGDIDVHGPVILDSTAIVMGNIKSKSMQINNGAVIEGMCSQCYADVSPASFFEDYKPENRKVESK